MSEWTDVSDRIESYLLLLVLIMLTALVAGQWLIAAGIEFPAVFNPYYRYEGV